MLSWLKILCAVDLSDGSRDALELAVDLAKRIDAELTLVHVFEKPPPVVGLPLPADLYDRTSREVEEELAAWRARAEQRTGMRIGTVLARGDATEEVLRIADDGKYDLVVTGTHGRSGLKRAIMGSVADKIVRRAPCPVLVARPPPSWGD